MNKLTIISALAVLAAGCSKTRADGDRDRAHGEAQTPVAISTQQTGGSDGTGGRGTGGNGAGGAQGSCGAGSCG